MGAASAAILLVPRSQRPLEALSRLRRHTTALFFVDNKIFNLANNLIHVGVRKWLRVLEIGRRITQRAEQVNPAFAVLANTEQSVELRARLSIIAACSPTACAEIMHSR